MDQSLSALHYRVPSKMKSLLANTTVYRIDPQRAKEPDPSDADPTFLNGKGSNLSAVLGRLESDKSKRDCINEWMEVLVPGIQSFTTKRQRLDHSLALVFKEKNTKRRFPARLMSDGTMYALGLLVAVLTRPRVPGFTLIEEPERGLHPAAIGELVKFVRESATSDGPIWVTTHSRAVVRGLQLDELVLVDKVDGRTRMKKASSGNLEQRDIGGFGLDETWLANLLDGGLPW